MNDIILSKTTKDELIQELKEQILSGISQLLDAAKEDDLNSKEFLTSKEVEQLLKISSVTRWTWTNNGILQARKINNRLRYRKDDVMNALILKEKKY
jgi:membrane protease subunit (stomatin/prohibitin family)